MRCRLQYCTACEDHGEGKPACSIFIVYNYFNLPARRSPLASTLTSLPACGSSGRQFHASIRPQTLAWSVRSSMRLRGDNRTRGTRGTRTRNRRERPKAMLRLGDAAVRPRPSPLHVHVRSTCALAGMQQQAALTWRPATPSLRSSAKVGCASSIQRPPERLDAAPAMAESGLQAEQGAPGAGAGHSHFLASRQASGILFSVCVSSQGNTSQPFSF